MEVDVQRHVPATLPPVPIAQEVGWARGPVWTGSEYLAATRIRFKDRPVRSESLYGLRYPDTKY